MTLSISRRGNFFAPARIEGHGFLKFENTQYVFRFASFAEEKMLWFRTSDDHNHVLFACLSVQAQ